MTKIAGVFIGLLILGSTFIYARELEVKGEAIALSQPGEFYVEPKWSPDGEQVAAGGPSYTGLYLLDFPTGNVRQISNDYSAGYGFSWSHDGTRIAARISQFDNMLRFHTLVTYTVADANKEQLTAPRTRMSGTPMWTADDSQIYLTFAEKFESFKTSHTNQPLSVPLVNYVRDGQFQSRRATQTTAAITESALFTDQDHIYSYAISPDGSHVAYSTAGQNLWVAKVNGDDRSSLGRGSAPSWSPDSEWITCMLTFDDGHAITASDLYAIRVQDNLRIELTDTPDLFEMNPHWSPDGEWIVYDTDQRGQLFIQQVGWR